MSVEVISAISLDANPAPRPGRVVLKGACVTLRPIDCASDADSLWRGTGGVEHAPLWEYMPDGPFFDRADFDAHLRAKSASEDPLFFAIIDNDSGETAGLASLMRIDTKNRVIEVGGIMYSPALQRSRGGTEAIYLLARYIFDQLGYRRFEWKCNALNTPSRTAALRYGFVYEGVFRQHMIVKGRNRDTAWFSMLDTEWPARRDAFQRWLDPANFDEAGRQKTRLAR